MRIGRSLDVAVTVGFSLRMAVRAKKPKVIHNVIERISVDMINVESQRFTIPNVRNTTDNTNFFLTSKKERPLEDRDSFFLPCPIED
jgi:hypothetical protein